jgi:nitrate reductase gamma subunit
MTETEFLQWVRGPLFDIATIIMVAGIIVRILQILLLGRKRDLAEAKGGAVAAGLRTIITRSVPDRNTYRRSAFTLTTGYIFHIGLFVVIFLFAPHILVFQDLLNISWPSLSTPVVDATSVVTMLALIAVLIHRVIDPVKRFLSQFQDYLAWFVTFLPLITGYIAFHRLVPPAPTMIAVHILSVELLMVLFPFTKLAHAFTLFISRWYNGAISGYRGVRS